MPSSMRLTETAMDKIILRNIKAFGHTGCLQEEKENGQFFYVTLELFCEDIPGKRSDDLEDTIDYAKATDIVIRTVSEDKSNLIEHLAYKIGNEVLAFNSLASSVDVTVSKPSAPVDAEFETMEVRITVAR